MQLRKPLYIQRRTVLVVDNLKTRFFVGDFCTGRVGSSPWLPVFRTMTMYDIVSTENASWCNLTCSSIVGNFFCVQKTDSFLFWDMHGSDTCTTKIGICIFLHACAFCILSNMVTRNEIVNIVAFMDDNRNLFMFFDRQKMWYVNRLNPIGRKSFKRAKICFEKFSSRLAR